jgi:coenzyme PQQ precursor peptide PqqA
VSGQLLAALVRRGNVGQARLHLSPEFECIFAKVKKEDIMAWTTPVLVEICIGLEINGYLPADGYVPPEF